MNCKECQSVLEEYFDRELERYLNDAVSVILEECEACASALTQMSVEQDVFQSYGNQLEVPKDLWSGIEARIVSKPEAALRSQPTWAQRLFAVPRLSVPVAAAL